MKDVAIANSILFMEAKLDCILIGVIIGYSLMAYTYWHYDKLDIERLEHLLRTHHEYCDDVSGG